MVEHLHEPPSGNRDGNVEAAAGSRDGTFSISLEFVGIECPGCAQICDPGRCPVCGAEVPDADTVDELTQARRKALGTLAEQARDLLASFDSLPEGAVPISVDQFVACVRDVDLFDRVGQMAELGHKLAEFDLNDPKVLGSDARQAVHEQLAKVRELREVAVELSRFAPEGPAGDLQSLAVESGRYGARLVDALLRAVTAPTIACAREAHGEVQELLSDFPLATDVAALGLRLDEWAAPDDDARIGSVLGRKGACTDEFGVLQPERIFGAFADHDRPFEALGHVAARYLERVLGPGTVPDEGAAALLALPAVALSLLERPLLAHREARLVYDLLDQAWARDPTAVRGLMRRATDQAPIILAAASRVQKSFRLLMIGMEAGEVDEETELTQAVRAYHEVVESAYRTLGWMTRDLARLVAGKSLAPDEDAPTVGVLEQQLASSNGRAANELATASDSALRNAAGHAQYRWDATEQQMEDLKTGQRWDVPTLELRMSSLISAVTGVDAAWACFAVARDVEIGMPSWAMDNSGLEASRFLATLSFSAHGFSVVEVRDSGATVVLDPPESIDPARLVPPLAGMSTVAPKAARYRVVSSSDGEALIEVDADVMERARDAGEDVKDLAVLETALSTMVNSERDRCEAVSEIAAVMVKVVAVSGLEELTSNQSPAAFSTVRRRLEYAAGLPARWNARSPGLDRLRRRLARTAASARLAPLNQSARRRFADQLPALADWADTQGVAWPPRLGPDR